MTLLASHQQNFSFLQLLRFSQFVMKNIPISAGKKPEKKETTTKVQRRPEVLLGRWCHSVSYPMYRWFSHWKPQFTSDDHNFIEFIDIFFPAFNRFNLHLQGFLVSQPSTTAPKPLFSAQDKERARPAARRSRAFLGWSAVDLSLALCRLASKLWVLSHY